MKEHLPMNRLARPTLIAALAAGALAVPIAAPDPALSRLPI